VAGSGRVHIPGSLFGIGGRHALEDLLKRCDGEAVVSTVFGAERVPVNNGRGCLARDETAAFRAAVGILLRDVTAPAHARTGARTLVPSVSNGLRVAGHLLTRV